MGIRTEMLERGEKIKTKRKRLMVGIYIHERKKRYGD